MSMIKNIHVSIPDKQGVLTRETPNPQNDPGDCEINIQTTKDWVITGKYRANILRTITLIRKSSCQRSDHV
jgi:hypothetical protein